MPMHRAPSRVGHVDTWLADYTLGRLGSETDRAIESHLLICDRCFAALIAQVVIGTAATLESASA